MLTRKQLFSLLLLGTLVLLCPPLFSLVTNHQWQPFAQTPFYLLPLYIVSETGTIPQVFLTCIFFAAIPLLYLKLPLKKVVIYFLIVVAYFGAGQLVKGCMKNSFQEARPFVTWLETEGKVGATEFYEMSRAERGAFIMRQDFVSEGIPSWQQEHWAKETGYSFPSGHTIFAAQWFLLYLLLLWRKKGYVPIFLMGIWAIAMLVSRMVLGMHWAEDVLASCLLAPILAYLTYYFGLKRWCNV